MNQITKSPSYLVRTPHSYCFRMNVPKDLQWVVGRKELRYSLKTGYLGTAKTKARVMAGHVQLLFKTLRRNENGIMDLPDDKIREMAVSYLERCKAQYDRPIDPNDESRPFDERENYITTTEAARDDILDELAKGDYWRVKDAALDLLREVGVDQEGTIDETSYLKLCESLLRSELKGGIRMDA